MSRLARVLIVLALAWPSSSGAAPSANGRALVYGQAPNKRAANPTDPNHSHVKHAKLGCDFCHAGAAQSRRAEDSLLPSAAQCATCHPTTIAARYTPTTPTRQLRFDHAAHAQKQIACQRCHLGPAELDAGRGLPAMADCLECHDSRRAPLHAAQRCQTCHLAERDGTLVTQLAAGPLVPTQGAEAHTPAFRTDHGRATGGRGKSCESCHRQDFCQSCHNGVVKPLDFHGNDYLTRHPLDARRAASKCSSCHRAQSFCLSCHERAGVGGGLPGSAFAPGGSLQFHPTGWADGHGPSARRNLKTCASCHREDSCMECHSTQPGGKQRTSPHPSGWRGSVRCESLAEKNARVCLRCHDDASCTP